MKTKTKDNNRMYKIIISAIIIVATLLCTFCISVNAAFENTGVSLISSEGGFLGIGAKNYRYDVYIDSRDWYVIFSDKNLCSPQYHVYNNGYTELHQDRVVTYSSESAYEFATRWPCNTSEDVIIKTVQAGYGIANTIAKGYAIDGINDIAVPATAPTGYYRTNVCHPYDLFKYEKYDSIGVYVGGTYEAIIPVGLPVIKVIYSQDSGTGGSIYNINN